MRLHDRVDRRRARRRPRSLAARPAGRDSVAADEAARAAGPTRRRARNPGRRRRPAAGHTRRLAAADLRQAGLAEPTAVPCRRPDRPRPRTSATGSPRTGPARPATSTIQPRPAMALGRVRERPARRFRPRSADCRASESLPVRRRRSADTRRSAGVVAGARGGLPVTGDLTADADCARHRNGRGAETGREHRLLLQHGFPLYVGPRETPGIKAAAPGSTDGTTTDGPMGDSA